MSAREKEVKIIRPTKEGDDAGYIRVGAYCRVSTDSEDQLNSFLHRSSIITIIFAETK